MVLGELLQRGFLVMPTITQITTKEETITLGDKQTRKVKNGRDSYFVGDNGHSRAVIFKLLPGIRAPFFMGHARRNSPWHSPDRNMTVDYQGRANQGR